MALWIARDPAAIQKARRLLWSKPIRYDNASGNVWCDVERTFAEKRPARLIHKAGDQLTLVEEARQDKRVIEKVMSGKQIKAGADVVAFGLHGELVWTLFGQSRYDESCRQQVEAACAD